MTLSAAMVGLGWWGQTLLASVHGRSDSIRIVAGVTVRADEANQARARFGIPVLSDYAAVLADPEVKALILATPHALHVEQITAAAGAGKHVFCEKPLALDAAGARRAVQACAAAGVTLAVGFNRRFYPAMRELTRLATSGALGTLLHVEGNFSHNRTKTYDPKGWRMSPENSPAGALGLVSNGIHALDALVEIGGPVRRAHAVSLRRAHAFPAHDLTAALLHFRSGATGQLTTMLGTPFIWHVRVFGTEGWAEVRDYNLLHRRHGDDTDETRSFAGAPIETLQLEAFAEAVRGSAPYPVTPAQALAGVAALEAIIRSIETGAPADAAETLG